MRNPSVTYYVSHEARAYFTDGAITYGYNRTPRRVSAYHELSTRIQAPPPNPSYYGVANFITAISPLPHLDTRDPALQALDITRAVNNQPPLWYDASYHRYQWHLRLPLTTLLNLLKIASQHNIQPITPNHATTISAIIAVTLETIGQGNLTPNAPIPQATYPTPLRYNASYPTRGGYSSYTPGYYL